MSDVTTELNNALDQLSMIDSNNNQEQQQQQDNTEYDNQHETQLHDQHDDQQQLFDDNNNQHYDNSQDQQQYMQYNDAQFEYLNNLQYQQQYDMLQQNHNRQQSETRRTRKPDFTTRLNIADSKPKLFSSLSSINQSPTNPDIRALVQKGREYYLYHCRDPRFINPIAEQGWNDRINVNNNTINNNNNTQQSTNNKSIVQPTNFLRKHSRAPLSPFLAAMNGYDVPAELYMNDKQRRLYYNQLAAAGVDVDALQQQTTAYHNALQHSSKTGQPIDPILHFNYWRTVDDVENLTQQHNHNIQTNNTNNKENNNQQCSNSNSNSNSSTVDKLRSKEAQWDNRFVVEKALDPKRNRNRNNSNNTRHNTSKSTYDFNDKAYMKYYLESVPSKHTNKHHQRHHSSKSKKNDKRRISQPLLNASIKFFNDNVEHKQNEL